MELIRWDPGRELDRVRAESDRLWASFLERLNSEFAASSHQAIAFLPDVDVVETARDVRVFVSVPGLIEEDIDISLWEDFLVVRGERQRPYDAVHARSRIAEWRYGYFERRIPVPLAGSAVTMRAAYDDGVLTITLTRA